MLYHKIMAVSAAVLFVSASWLGAAMPAGYQGTPFAGDGRDGSPHRIPGEILAVHFDEGGEGVAFHDEGAGNQGGTMRPNQADLPVDMQVFTDHDFMEDGSVAPMGDKWHLSWIGAAGGGNRGEWENYTVYVETAGQYEVDFFWAVAFANGRTSITFSGLDPIEQVNPPISIRPPGDHEIWHDWKWDSTISVVTLDTGLYVLTLEFIEGSWNFSTMNFRLAGGTSAGQVLSQAPLLGLTAIQAGNLLNIMYTPARSGAVNFRIMDFLGRDALPGFNRNATGGRQAAAIDIRPLSNGFYHLQMEQDGAVTTRMIPVRK